MTRAPGRQRRTARLLLIVLRVFQGIGVGGEWGGSVLLSMDVGTQRRRGFWVSWPQIGVPIGLLLSAGMVKLFSHIAGDSFNSWGWRVPFALSLVLDRDRAVRPAARAGEPGV